MNRVRLDIICTDDHTKTRCTANRWKFQDTMMGEQFITFSITSETPIDFAVGDFCVFRGETYTLNYVPSVTQKARSRESQDAYTYDNVKLESFQEELTRCIMLDITPTTGDYVAALGTNYTGSINFQLFCGEVSANGKTLTAVCALAAKMQANLDRMFPTNRWKILVDTTTTYKNTAGEDVLVTHTDDKALSFNNTTVAKALEEVHTTFDLDYSVRGRNIYIGYTLKDLTSDKESETFAFGYGKGYPTREDMNKGLFQLKRIANSQQKIVTRLRAMGSTKNMPYRYYNKKYNLSQSLFPTNLQLPDTFATPSVKAANNALRDSSLRAVKGDTNDAYIDKNDDAEHCSEGVREGCAVWDGSNSDLPEIYPTIEEATYGELRNAMVQDQDGHTGSSAFPNYGNTERIDKLLAIGYKDSNRLVDDANKGNGITPENDTSSKGIHRPASIGLKNLNYNTSGYGDFTNLSNSSNLRPIFAGPEVTLFTIQGVSAGKYIMSPTYGAVYYSFRINSGNANLKVNVGYRITIKQKNLQTGNTTDIATYHSDFEPEVSRDKGIIEVELPELPDVKNTSNTKVPEIKVTALSDITVIFTPIAGVPMNMMEFTDNFSLEYQVGNSRLDNTAPYAPEYNWSPLDDGGAVSSTFHVFIQDMGFDLQASLTGDTPVLAMKSGRCVGREFEIGENIEKVTHNGKKGYMLTLKRATDSKLNTYYPSATDPIAAGDHFVLLNIIMPDVFIEAAEIRLLRAATEYLADNSETQFTWQPDIDDIYLQRNLDRCRAEGREQDSIWWRLYAGLKFTFIARFASDDEDKEDALASASITIEQVSISMGEGLTPKVDLKLNDDIQQSTIQKLTTSVDRIYNGSIFSSGSGSGFAGATSATLLSLLQSEGEKRFLSKRHDDRARGRITFEQGLRIGLDENGYIDERGNAELLSIVVRAMLRSPKFVNGFTGEGWRLWLEDGLSKLEIDELTVRRAMRIFELLIDKIRSVGGQIIVSAANGKIKNVESTDSEYRIEFETANEFVEGDLMRMGVFTGNELRSYWVEVNDVVDGKVIINKTEFEDWVTEPKVGDEVVLMGNTTNSKRQNLISISATEDGQPRIEVVDGVKEKNFAGGLRTRLGNLDGISDSYFPADSQPHGNGLYADNAYLRGRFVVVNRDGSSKDILTMFDITEGKIESAVSALRRDTTDQGILSNGTFGKGLKSWTTENEWKPLFNSDNPLWDSKGIVQGGNIVVSVADDMGYTSAEINNSYIMQKNEDMREIPEFYAPDGNAKDARTVYLSFFYRCETAGTLKVGFQDLNKTDFNDFEAMSEERVLNATEGYTQYTLSGKWNGTGNLLISFTGKIHIAGVVLSENQNDALVYRYSTLFEQSDKLVKIAAANFDVNGNVLEESDIITTAKYNTLMSKYFNSDGSLVNVAGVVTTTDFNAFKEANGTTISGIFNDIIALNTGLNATKNDINTNYVKIEAFSGMFASAVDENGIAKTSQLASYVTKQTGEDGKTYLESGVIVKADNINLEGYTTINEHFRINTSGDMEAINGKFSGEIYANKGIIGGFSLANGYIGSAKVTWNDDGTPNIPKDRWGLALADTYMVFNGLKKQILLDIHDLTNPDNPDVITHFDGPLMRLEDTYKDTGATMPKKGLVFDIANASGGRNFAFCGKGNGVLNGFIDGYGFDKRILTENNTYYDTAIRNSNRLIVNSKASGAGIVLPKLTEMINALGIDNTTPFAFRLTVIADIGSNDFKVLGRNTSASTGSGWNNAEYPVMVTWQNNVWGENEIGSSDSMEFLLVYDPSRTDTLDGFTTKWTARIINVLQG